MTYLLFKQYMTYLLFKQYMTRMEAHLEGVERVAKRVRVRPPWRKATNVTVNNGCVSSSSETCTSPTALAPPSASEGEENTLNPKP